MSTQPDKTIGQIELKPCPFCGRIPTDLQRISYTDQSDTRGRCECGAEGPSARFGRHWRAWNRRIDSVAQAQPVQSLEEIAREAASEVDDLCDCYCQSDVTEKEPIIFRACQAAVMANREQSQQSL